MISFHSHNCPAPCRHYCVCVWAQLCPTLCSLMHSSPPGFSVHGVSQTKILEWVAISYSRGSSWPRDRTCVSCVSCIGRWILYHCTTWETCGHYYPHFIDENTEAQGSRAHRGRVSAWTQLSSPRLPHPHPPWDRVELSRVWSLILQASRWISEESLVSSGWVLLMIEWWRLWLYWPWKLPIFLCLKL